MEGVRGREVQRNKRMNVGEIRRGEVGKVKENDDRRRTGSREVELEEMRRNEGRGSRGNDWKCVLGSER